MSLYTLRSDVPLTDVPGIVNGTINPIIECLVGQDYETLANPSMIGMLYFVLFMILFLENGLLPAAFLPGDSLLVLVGVLIAKGAMGFPETLLLLTTAASLGCWLSYIQGRWLGNTRIVQNWLSHCPPTTTSARITCFISTGSPPADGPLYRLRSYAAADHCRTFGSEQRPLPVL
jgi:hypothetical protein